MEAQQEKTLAMLCHLGALAGIIVPFGNIIVPLVIWLIKKNESALIDQNGKEALNFQITLSIAAFISMLLMVVVIGVLTHNPMVVVIGVPLLLFVVGIYGIVMIIIAGVKVNKGEEFKYPICLRLIK